MNKVIHKVNFNCEECNNIVYFYVSGSQESKLNEIEKNECLNYCKYIHQSYVHLVCWRCKKQILPKEINNVEIVNGKIKDLCSNCAKI